jgi:hypothetical protein
MWLPWAILVSDWLKFKKSSPLKLGGTMNCYFVGMMYGKSCTKFPYFVPITQTQSTEPLVIIIHLLRFSCTVESCYLKVHGSLQNFELSENST